MRYILTLFLISLVASSEIIDKADEIKEFSEYDDVELQIFFLIPFIAKAISVGIGLIAKAKLIFTGAKIFKFVKGAISVGSKIVKGARGFISKGKALLGKSKFFRTGKQILEKGRQYYNKFKGTIEKSRLYQKGKRLYDKGRNIYNKYKNMIENNKYYKAYKKVKDTYDEVKDYYDKGKDFYDRYIAKREQEEQQQTPEQKRREEEKQKQLEKSRAYTRYHQIRNNNGLTLTQKQSQLNAHLNYMQSKGFISAAQRQQMAKIPTTYSTTRTVRNTSGPVRNFGVRRTLNN